MNFQEVNSPIECRAAAAGDLGTCTGTTDHSAEAPCVATVAVSAAVLVLLDEKPSNGYQLIQELTERSNETWRPSPGSIYPVLQQLEDEGLVEASTLGTGRTYALTDAGRQLVNEQREQLGRPWENTDGGANISARELMGTARQVLIAGRQVLMAGSEAQVAKAITVLAETRRSLYSILAEGDDA
jgi:DNA-binding PadR family transcriptional regulator